MISVTWTLEPDAEREYLLPWLLAEPDPQLRVKVLAFIADVLRNPDRPSLRSDTGVYSVDAVRGTDVGLVWILDPSTREVVLAFVGRVS